MSTTEGTALVLQVSVLGEKQRLLTVFSANQGRMRGVLRGLKNKPCQPLDRISYTHYRRLDSQLGTFEIEIEQARVGWWLGSRINLLAANWLLELLLTVLPDEQPYPALAQLMDTFLDEGIREDGVIDLWRQVVRLELLLLHQVGYGLSLAADPVRGEANGAGQRDETPLSYVSPNSGRAISALMGGPYKERLLVLPAGMGGPEQGVEDEALASLRLTGHFLTQAVHGKPLEARRQLVQALLGQPERRREKV